MKGEIVMTLKIPSQMIEAGFLAPAASAQASEQLSHDDEPFNGVAAD